MCAGLRGGQASSGVRLGDMGVGDLGDFGFIDTLKNALETGHGIERHVSLTYTFPVNLAFPQVMEMI